MATEPGLFEIIHSTRAMRRLKPDPVPDELIAEILRAGVCAPSGANSQQWCFLVVKDPDVTVGRLGSAAGAEILGFTRFEVGEGIEKEEVDFAAEVAAQLNS